MEGDGHYNMETECELVHQFMCLFSKCDERHLSCRLKKHNALMSFLMGLYAKNTQLFDIFSHVYVDNNVFADLNTDFHSLYLLVFCEIRRFIFYTNLKRFYLCH